MNILTDTKFKEIFSFDEPRNNQREIIEKIIKAYNDGKKYVILSAPTGTGKSCIGYAVARYFGSSYILTSQKVLQDQYYKDFKIPFVLGRSNYTCQKNTSLTCDFGACMKIAKKMCIETVSGVKTYTCPYLMARENCLSSVHSNLNYSYFLSALNADGLIKERGLIVCDEGHNLEEELLKQYIIKINKDILKFLGNLQIKLPNIVETDAHKCKWLCFDFNEKVKNEYLYLKTQLDNLTGMKSTREYKKISNKKSILEDYLTKIEMIHDILNKGESIIISQDKDSMEFKLLHSNKIFEKTISKYSSRFLFMSASILNYKQFAADLGLSLNNIEYIECDSTFPVENRLIHYSPVGSMSYKTKYETLPKMIQKIDKILKENKNVKGIIHTVNYETAEKIIEGLSFSDQSYRLLMPKGADKQVMLNAFYNSTKPYVLISPSLTEGIDLKEDLSRLCIICKVPYANLGDNWVKTRMNESREWYINKACINLVQMSGRSIRSETDYATTYILDSDFMKLAQGSMDILPKWWQESVIVD